MNTLKTEDYIAKQLEKLGYWKTLYSKADYFGTGPTKLAFTALDIMKKNNVSKILELGCGQGRDCTFFAEKGYLATAIDFSSEAIDFVKITASEKKLANLQAIVQNLKEIDFVQEFDCVYSNLALQFFNENELEKIFEKISTSVKNNGLFIFSTKKPGDKYYKVGEKINDNAYKTKGITRYFFEKDVLSKILGKRFRIEIFEDANHTNPDGSISMWWYSVARKR